MRCIAISKTEIFEQFYYIIIEFIRQAAILTNRSFAFNSRYANA
jgi:hypothetical protein